MRNVTRNGVSLSNQRNEIPPFANNMYGLRGCYAQWTKSDRGRQILYGFPSMWNLKVSNRQNKNRHTEIEIDLVVGEPGGGKREGETQSVILWYVCTATGDCWA